MSQMHSLSITHEIFVPREIVFEAWTDPDHLVCWYSPGEGYERRAEVDLQPGGRIRFAWSKPGGESVVQEGEIVAVERPLRVVYVVKSRDASAHELNEVSISFVDLGGRTRIEIHQSGLESEDIRRRQAERWQLFFAQLENYLSSI